MRKKHAASEILFGFNVIGQQQRFNPGCFLLLLCVLPPGCVRPPGVQHGDLLNQTEANRGSFAPGSLLMYGCEPGYAADGPTSIICTSLGVWSHQPPRCIRNNGKRQCEPLVARVHAGFRGGGAVCLWLFLTSDLSQYYIFIHDKMPTFQP